MPYFIFTIFMVTIAGNIVSNNLDNVNMYLVSPELGLPVLLIILDTFWFCKMYKCIKITYRYLT